MGDKPASKASHNATPTYNALQEALVSSRGRTKEPGDWRSLSTQFTYLTCPDLGIGFELTYWNSIEVLFGLEYHSPDGQSGFTILA